MAQANIKAVITAEDRASNTLSKFSDNTSKMGTRIADSLKKAAAAAAVAASAATIFGVKTAADLESAEVGFKTLLGSAEAAREIMQNIKDEAKRTPFEIAGLTQATQMLTAVTKDGDRALNFILDVGEGLAAMGRGQAELDRVAVNLQQIAATGRAFGIDIRQFAFAGIPIYEMLTDKIGLSGEALQDFIEEGGVTFELLEEMFKDATDEGGQWANAFENQAGTFNQLLSNLKDSFAVFVSDFVRDTGIFDRAKNVIQSLTDILTGNSESFSRLTEKIRFAAETLFTFFLPVLETLWNSLRNRLWPQIKNLINALEPGLSTALKVIGVLLGLTLLTAIKLFISGVNVAVSVIGAFVRVISTAIKWTGNLGGKIINVGRVMVSAFTGVAGTIRDAFKSSFNFIADAWNNTVGKLSFKVPSWIPAIGGRGWEVPDIAKFAKGTDFAPGGMALVGEKGPELVNLPRGSEVRTADETRKMMGGNITFNVNIGLYAGSEMEKRRVAQELMRAWQDASSAKGMAI